MENLSEKFLFAEFENSYSEWRRILDEGNQRIQYLFSMMTLIFTGLGFLIQIKGIDEQSTNVAIILGLLILYFIGIYTLRYFIQRNILIDLNTRAIARLRRYFIEKDIEIAKYITWQMDDSPTGFLEIRGGLLIRMTQLILSLITGLLLISVLRLLFKYEAFILLIAGISGFAISYITIRIRWSVTLKKTKEDVKKSQRFGPIENTKSEFEEL